MVDHLAVLTALRARLKTLTVATTGVTSLSSTATGYARSTGSFIDDGLFVGAEVKPTGFVHTASGVITGMTDTSLTILGGRPIQAEGAGRSLTIGLPSDRAWENTRFSSSDTNWYVDEDYLPGPTNRTTLGTDGELDSEPTYVLRLHGLADTGITAIYRVTDAILRLFLPNSYMAVGDSYLYVKSSPAPYRGQVLTEGASHVVVVITIPLWIRTPRGD